MKWDNYKSYRIFWGLKVQTFGLASTKLLVLQYNYYHGIISIFCRTSALQYVLSFQIKIQGIALAPTPKVEEKIIPPSFSGKSNFKWGSDQPEKEKRGRMRCLERNVLYGTSVSVPEDKLPPRVNPRTVV